MGAWVETFKGAVLASEYDAEAYMNSPIYVSRFDQATWFLLHAVSVTPASIKKQKLRVAIVRQNYQFLKELRGGELVATSSGFLAVGKKYLRFVHRMVDCATSELLATSDCTAVLASLRTGRSVPLPAALQQRAKAHLVTLNSMEASARSGATRRRRQARRRS
jgi:acyl-CoA thioesterase FadM